MNMSGKNALSNRKFLASTDKVASSKPNTKVQKLPAYLKVEEQDSSVRIFSDGGIKNKLKVTHWKVFVTRNFKTVENARDSCFSFMHGARTILTIKQGREQAYKPRRCAIPIDKPLSRHSMARVMDQIQVKYELRREVLLQKHKEGQEVQSARVAEKIFSYLEQGNTPPWELPDMMAKHSTTTNALELLRKKIYLNTDHESL